MMGQRVESTLEDLGSGNFYTIANYTCDRLYPPSAAQLLEGLGNFGVGLISIGSIISAATLYLAVDACKNVCYRKESTSFKINVVTVLSVYPIASLCSLVAMAIPRSQLLSEALIQVALTISLYRLYNLLIDIGRRNATKTPPMMLKVGPCCCWPCLPFPTLEMTEANLSWLRISILQFPIVQGLIYCIQLFMFVEDPVYVDVYGVFLLPLVIISILLGIYGLTIATKSLQEVAPEAKLPAKTLVSQLVLLFSKLQGFIIKNLAGTGLFPCRPPISPLTYANVTYDALMVIEMLLLCYAARLIYAEPERDENEDNTVATDRSKDKTDTMVVGVTNNCYQGSPVQSVRIPFQRSCSAS